jgi:hypothetical protein
MSRENRLNGLPHDLVKSYLATDKYCVCGYMADWLFYAAKRLNINEITIDIINKTYIPSELNFHPFTFELAHLNGLIESSLSLNGFGKDFIIEAKIKVIFHKESKKLICIPWLTDKDNKRYEVEQITEFSYEEEFNPFNLNEEI